MKSWMPAIKRLASILFLLFITSSIFAAQFGLYLTEPTASRAKKLQQIIRQAKAVGINTFVVDYAYYNTRFLKNIKLLHKNGIRYVARIVVFPPHGADRARMKNKKYWQKRYKLVSKALAAGADEIQLDYIRYNTKVRRSAQNSIDVFNVISWFRKRIPVPLQIDVFGVSAHKPSQTIGQNLKLFASTVDTMCPMVYPSHYYPYRKHAMVPYKTVYNSLMSLRAQFAGRPPVKIIPWLEQSNFRIRLSGARRVDYLWQQIQAAKNARAQGYYIWSANNRYKHLFNLLKRKGKPW